ncbi:MAG: hypothetical protein V1754_10640 [Pseudomonadota bacterium]
MRPIILMAIFWGVPAQAAELLCTRVEAGVIQMDGLLGDWQGVRPMEVNAPNQITIGREHWSGERDLSFSVYCNSGGKHLFLAVHVKDERFVRTSKARGDDHVVFNLEGQRLEVFPGDLKKIDARVNWGNGKRAKEVSVAEAMQRDGYSIEVKIPLKALEACRKGMPFLSGSVVVADSDLKSKSKVQTIMTSGPIRLSFPQTKDNLKAFLDAKGYQHTQIRFNAVTDVVGNDGVEQVILVGRTLGILGGGVPSGTFFFLDLPVRDPKDVYWLKLLDLNGDKKVEMVVQFAQQNAVGRRELLVVYRYDDKNEFVRPFAHELVKAVGNRTITNQIEFKKRRRKRNRPGGIDLIISNPVANGFSKENYREMRAEDAIPILLPWGEEKKHQYRFEGDEYYEY